MTTERAREIAHRIMSNGAVWKCGLYLDKPQGWHSPTCDWTTDVIAAALSRAKAEGWKEGAEAMREKIVERLRSEGQPGYAFDMRYMTLPTPKDDHGGKDA